MQGGPEPWSSPLSLAPWNGLGISHLQVKDSIINALIQTLFLHGLSMPPGREHRCNPLPPLPLMNFIVSLTTATYSAWIHPCQSTGTKIF